MKQLPSLQMVISTLQTGQAQLAEQLCQQICAANPSDANALHLLAVIYVQTQQLGLAEHYFLKAITGAPSRGDFLGNYGNLLFEQGRFAEAIQYCGQAISKGHQRPEVHNTLGNAWYKTGEFATAADCYHQALAIQPNYPQAYNNLGQTLRAQHDYLGAEQCFLKALALQPDFPDAAENLKAVDSTWLKPLVGGGVQLHRYTAEATDFLWDCYHDRDLMHFYNRFMVMPSDKASLAEQLTAEAIRHPLESRVVNWIMCVPATNGDLRPIGIANLVDIQPVHRRAEFLIGIPGHDNRAARAATAATLLIMDFAFNRVGLNKLVTFVYSDNEASLKNNAALGFTPESLLRDHLWHAETQQFIDLRSNGMTLADFRANSRLAKVSQRLLGWDVTAEPDANAAT